MQTNEKAVAVNSDTVHVSPGATVAEVKAKAGLPKNAKAYDPQSGNLLPDNAPAPTGWALSRTSSRAKL